VGIYRVHAETVQWVYWVGNYFYVGGYNGQKTFDECYSFDLNIKEWEKVEVANFQPCCAHTVTNVSDEKVVIFGGLDRNAQFTNVFWSVTLQ